MSDRNKKQRKMGAAARQNAALTLQDILERLHPSLHESFILLPPAGTSLSPEQLEAVFAGDLRGLRDMVKLVYKPRQHESE